MQTIGVTIRLHNGQPLNIISVYFNGNVQLFGEFRREIRKIASQNSIIIGDFNPKHSYWGC